MRGGGVRVGEAPGRGLRRLGWRGTPRAQSATRGRDALRTKTSGPRALGGQARGREDGEWGGADREADVEEEGVGVLGAERAPHGRGDLDNLRTNHGAGRHHVTGPDWGAGGAGGPSTVPSRGRCGSAQSPPRGCRGRPRTRLRARRGMTPVTSGARHRSRPVRDRNGGGGFRSGTPRTSGGRGGTRRHREGPRTREASEEPPSLLLSGPQALARPIRNYHHLCYVPGFRK
jgi:hypothetical protein